MICPSGEPQAAAIRSYPDLQAGAEYGFTLLNAALDGCNLIHDCGYIGQGFVASPEMIIFADEVIAFVKRYMRGFAVDDEHLAMDVIKRSARAAISWARNTPSITS
jgi:trimethylamine:corrinoid methyltransferase-like protein